MAEIWADTTGAGDAAASPLGAAIAEGDRNTLAYVREALQRRRLLLAYQPVIMGGDPSRIAFHEGLIRVLDPSGRVIPARDFMGAVETTDLGRLIDCAALEMGLDTLRREPGLRLAVNMSARSIGYPRWVEVLRRGLSDDATVGERLILEITESSAMLMPELVTTFMDGLQKKGIAFGLDDFGAGFTAFRYFKDFFFDMVKIDGQFIRGIARDPDNQVLTQALMMIARQFDMFTVAESVEDPLDASWLQSIGIDCMQGYLFGAPTTMPSWSAGNGRLRA